VSDNIKFAKWPTRFLSGYPRDVEQCKKKEDGWVMELREIKWLIMQERGGKK
jgi:hypothetical protein